MPAEIAHLADGIWQRALKLSSEAAIHDDNAARERLRQLEVENEIKQRSFELREREIDTQARERERALADARDHLLSLSKALAREQATNQAQERRIADLEAQIAQYRQQIGALIAGVIAEKRSGPTPARAKSLPPRASGEYVSPIKEIGPIEAAGTAQGRSAVTAFSSTTRQSKTQDTPAETAMKNATQDTGFDTSS